MTFGVYVHVPFCSSRCGYCDFNTYTPSELGGSSPDSYLDALEKELDAAAQTYPLGPADTVFIGGGTPSLIGAAGLERVLRAVRNSFGVAPHAEITTEANPESTSQEFFDHIRAAGYNRVSLGMQSASTTVLRILERRHTPGRAFQAIAEAHATGFEHLNLDVIYGTPGESDDDLRATLDAVLDAPVDHVSAYSLIVEDGTAMARKVRKGIIPPPDEDTYADRYAMIDQELSAAGFDWYEVSNWAKPGGQCLHNLGYWRDHDYYGAGPGAHSHIGNIRFYNVKHPATYAAQATQPQAGSEELTPHDRHTEALMLGLRLREGICEDIIGAGARDVINDYINRGLLARTHGRLHVTDAGRLLADGIIADILVAEGQ